MKAQGTPYHPASYGRQMKRVQEKDTLVRMKKLGMNFKIVPDPIVDPEAEKKARALVKKKRQAIKVAKRSSRGSVRGS
jgi:hypothetical protein